MVFLFSKDTCIGGNSGIFLNILFDQGVLGDKYQIQVSQGFNSVILSGILKSRLGAFPKEHILTATYLKSHPHV